MGKKERVIFLIVGLLIGLIVGYGIGYSKGAADTLNFGIKVAKALVERGDIKVDIDTEMLTRAAFQYKERIGGCLFIENASIYND